MNAFLQSGLFVSEARRSNLVYSVSFSALPNSIRQFGFCFFFVFFSLLPLQNVLSAAVPRSACGGRLGASSSTVRARSGCSARKLRACERARVDPAQHPGTWSRSILIHLLLHLPPAAAVSSSSTSPSSRLLLPLQLGQFHIIVSVSYFHQFPDLSPSRVCFWLYFLFRSACANPPPSPDHHRGAMT